MTQDLHTHSTASDGTLAPAELVAHVAACGVTTLALTDHDTVAGLAEARRAAATHAISLIDGIELSASWRGRTLHVVGLNIDPAHPVLVAGITRQQAERTRRAAVLVERLEALGVSDVARRLEAMAPAGQITRAHFARLLVDDGRAHRVADAFKRYLKPGRPAYVRSHWAELHEIIDWIHAASGTSVLAHPFGYGFSGAWRRRALAAFAAAGGHGVEIVTGTTNLQQEQQITREAREHRLAGSRGSDFHGPFQFWLVPGRLRPLPDTATPMVALAAA